LSIPFVIVSVNTLSLTHTRVDVSVSNVLINLPV